MLAEVALESGLALAHDVIVAGTKHRLDEVAGEVEQRLGDTDVPVIDDARAAVGPAVEQRVEYTGKITSDDAAPAPLRLDIFGDGYDDERRREVGNARCLLHAIRDDLPTGNAWNRYHGFNTHRGPQRFVVGRVGHDTIHLR